MRCDCGAVLTLIGKNEGYAYKIWNCPRCGLTIAGYGEVAKKKKHRGLAHVV